MIPTTKAEEKANRKKHDAAMKEYYAKKGIGRSLKQKYAFWHNGAMEKGGYSISHMPDDPKEAMKYTVAVFELLWITNTFCEDFPHC